MENHQPHMSPIAEKKDEASAPQKEKGKGGPRKRVSQACDRCRSRKDKCDGKKPACSTCITNNRQCSYDVNVKKRGLPEGYVRGMEKMWGLVVQEVDGIEDKILQVTRGDGEPNTSTFQDIWNDETYSETLVEAWNKSNISRELNLLLAAPETQGEVGKRRRTSSLFQHEKKPDIEFPTIADDTSLLEWRNKEDLGSTNSRNGFQNLPVFQSSSEAGQGTIGSVQSLPIQSIQRQPSITVNSSQATPELPPEAWHLLDVYFSYTHIWLPMIDRLDLMRTSYQYSQNRQAILLDGPGSGNHAALWAAIAYAKYQDKTIAAPASRALDKPGIAVWTAEKLYAQARSLIPNEEGYFELGHVQALLILALANLGLGHANRASILVGQAVRIALSLKLDKTNDDVMSALSHKSKDKHVFLGCFVMDTLVAGRVGRRPHLRAEDVENIGQIEEEGLEEWDPWTDSLSIQKLHSGTGRGPASILSTFNRLVQVLRISNEAACVYDSKRKSHDSSILLEKLHIWSHSQSSPIYFDSSVAEGHQATSLLPHQHNLHLTYFNTLATSQLLAYNHGQERTDLEPSTRSARHITKLLKQYDATFGLLAVPPTFEHFTKTAYDIIHEVTKSAQNTQIMLDDWKLGLDTCLGEMKSAWPVFETLKSSVTNQVNDTPSLGGRRHSQVAFDLITGSLNPPPPQLITTPNTIATYNSLTPPTIRPYHTLAASNVSTSPSSHRSMSFGTSTTHPFSQLRQENFDNPSAWLQPQTEFEFDPTFQEFAAMDATKWTSNWDQSLQNLGFTDPEHMNQDFYLMSREPDPLAMNNVFQQLLATSNTETADFFGSAGGFEISEREQEGIEAGAILQSLRDGGGRNIS